MESMQPLATPRPFGVDQSDKTINLSAFTCCHRHILVNIKQVFRSIPS